MQYASASAVRKVQVFPTSSLFIFFIFFIFFIVHLIFPSEMFIKHEFFSTYTVIRIIPTLITSDLSKAIFNSFLILFLLKNSSFLFLTLRKWAYGRLHDHMILIHINSSHLLLSEQIILSKIWWYRWTARPRSKQGKEFGDLDSWFLGVEHSRLTVGCCILNQ